MENREETTSQNNENNGLSQEAEDELRNVLLQARQQQNETERISADYQRLVQTPDDYMLIERLAPEIEANEKLKRNLKKHLMYFLLIVLLVQFVFLIYLVNYAYHNIFNMENITTIEKEIVNGVVIKETTKTNGRSTVEIQALLTFIGTYITALVVELIYILKRIVENVFDSSIVELTKAFKVSAQADHASDSDISSVDSINSQNDVA